MNFLVKNIELINTKQNESSVFFGEKNNINFSSIPYKTDFFCEKLNDNYYAACNFSKNSGPVVINSYAKILLGFVDGKLSLWELKERFLKNADFSLQDFKKYFYLIKHGSVSSSDLYESLLKDKPLILPHEFIKIFAQFYSSGLIDFRGIDKNKLSKVGTNSSIQVWLHLTEKCNLACTYCYVKKNSGSMTLDFGKKLVDKLYKTALSNNINHILFKFGGGEPLLVLPLITGLIDYINNKFEKSGIKTDFSMVSNGTLITDEAVFILEKYKISMAISLDGVGRWHDAQAKYADGRGSFSNVEKGMNVLIKHGKTPGFISVISAKNLDGFVELAKYFSEKRLITIVNFVRKTPEMPENFLPDINKLTKSIFEIYDVLRKNLPQNYLVPSYYCNRVPNYSGQVVRFWCGVGENYLVVHPDGVVVPCVMSLGDRFASVGNINDTDDLLSLIRKKDVVNKNPPLSEKETCRGCRFFDACKCGCPADNFYSFGDYKARSRYCEVYKKTIPEALKLSGEILIKHHRK